MDIIFPLTCIWACATMPSKSADLFLTCWTVNSWRAFYVIMQCAAEGQETLRKLNYSNSIPSNEKSKSQTKPSSIIAFVIKHKNMFWSVRTGSRSSVSSVNWIFCVRKIYVSTWPLTVLSVYYKIILTSEYKDIICSIITDTVFSAGELRHGWGQPFSGHEGTFCMEKKKSKYVILRHADEFHTDEGQTGINLPADLLDGCLSS